MIKICLRTAILLAVLSGTAAFAFDNPLGGLQLANFNPLERGPLADFLSIFREQAIPREVVAWRRGYKPGTVVISTSERRLYYVLPGGEAIRYGVGVGREGFTWSGTKTVTMKREWPDWTPPQQMLKRRPICRVICRAASTIRLAPAPSTLARACIAFMARTSRTRSAPPCPRAASG